LVIKILYFASGPEGVNGHKRALLARSLPLYEVDKWE